MTNKFYQNIEILDKFLSKSPTSLEDILQIKDLLQEESYQKYFYQKLTNYVSFNLLNKELETTKLIKEPTLSPDGKYIQISPWWPGRYLINVASKIPEEVLSIIEKIETQNSHAIDDCSKAILNMPDDFLRYNYNVIVNIYDKWLDAKYVGTVKYEIDDLFDKLVKAECFEGALKLLDILSKIKKEKDDTKLRFEIHYYKEIIKRHLARLAEYNAISLLSIIEANLRYAIKIETRSKSEKDYSTMWRPAIEDNPQNYDFDQPKDIFVEILRDVLYKILQNKPDDAKRIIAKYLKDKYSIFRRLAIHSSRLSNFDDLIKSILTNKSNLNNTEIHHEFFMLVEEKFDVLNSKQKNRFISRIIEMPVEKITREQDKDRAEKYKESWQTRRLLMVKKYLEKDEDIKEFKYLLDSYHDKFAKMDSPDLLSYHTAWVGPTSALTKEEIAKKSPEEFINWTKINLQPPYEIREASPEGVARILQEVVKEKPESYARSAEKFIDEKILPSYLCGFLRGLEEAIKNNKTFELEPVIKFIESPLKFHAEPKFDSRHDVFDIGKYSWIRGVIANFIEALVMKDEFVLTEDILNRTQHILVELIEKDEDPTEKDEKEYGKEAKNMDYTTYCINSNRGKAMCALMQHALKRARMRPEEEKKKEEGKGPFPPGERMDLYKEFLTKRLDDEKSPSVQSSYGRFMPYLCYLDQDWLKNMIKSEKLFPKNKELQNFWEAHWEGYIGFHSMYNQLYDLLKENYIRAVDNLTRRTDKKEKFERYDDKLAEHLMIAYWRKIEDIKIGQILDKFFGNAPINIRGHAIWFLASAIEETKPKVDSEEWKRLRKLWEYRIENCKDDERGNFVKWLKNCPENINDIAHLIKSIIPFLSKHFNEEDFFEYLLLKVDEGTLISLELLDQLLSMRTQGFLQTDKIKEILKKATVFKTDSDIAQAINKVVNTLGTMGYYDFREMLV